MTPFINQTGRITYQKLEAEGWDNFNGLSYVKDVNGMYVQVDTSTNGKNVYVWSEKNHVFSCITFEQINAFLNIIKEGDL